MKMPPDLSPYVQNVPRETIEKLEAYAALLEQWQRHINLVAPSTLPDLWHRHFADSLQLVPYLRSPDLVIADIGSGAGFPGMVLAIMGYGAVHLVESDQRKGAYLREVARITETHITLHTERAEHLCLPDVDVFISRACGSLNKLLNMLGPKCKKNTICLFHKGKNYTKELEDVEGWRFTLRTYPSRVENDSVILELTDIMQEVAP